MEFKFSSYENCLNFAVEENYKFVNLSNALESNEKSILLRHDIDFSLDHAIKIAEIEKSLDVQATYFVRTHCKYYNALSYSSKEILNKLESLGHIVGLHFEEDYYPEENLYESIHLEKQILDSFLQTPLQHIAPHEPTRTNRLEYDDNRLKEVGIKFQAYDKDLLEKYKYISDSSGKFKDGFLEEHLVKNKETYLYVLTHPVWWFENSPVERY